MTVNLAPEEGMVDVTGIRSVEILQFEESVQRVACVSCDRE